MIDAKTLVKKLLDESADANPIPAGITPAMSRGRWRGKPANLRDRRRNLKLARRGDR